MDKRKIKILALAICGVVIVAWAVWLVIIFQNGRTGNTENGKSTEVPEGYVMVWVPIEEYRIDADGTKQISTKFTYDKHARCTSMQLYNDGEEAELYEYAYDDETGNLFETEYDRYVKTERTYDSLGRERKVVKYWINDNGEYEIDVEFEYDENKMLTREVSYYEGVMHLEVLYTYDKYGHTISETERNPKGEESLNVRAECDSLGRVLRQYRVYRSEDEINGVTETEYLGLEVEYYEDGSRKEESRSSYDARGTVTISTYDPEGNETEMVRKGYNPDNKYYEESWVYTTDEQGRKIQTRFDRIGNAEYRRIFETVRSGQEYTERTDSWWKEPYDGVKNEVFTNTYILHGANSTPEDGPYDKQEYADCSYDEEGKIVSEYRSTREYFYDEHDNLVSAKTYDVTENGTTEYSGGGEAVYTSMIIAEEQARLNAQFYNPVQR